MKGVDAPQDQDAPPYVPPSPVNLAINVNQNNHYEIFSLDIEDPMFPDEHITTTIGTVASAPTMPRNYDNYPAYSL